MPRKAKDPLLAALAQEVAALPFPYQEPAEPSKGLVHWASGRGIYAVLRIGGQSFNLGAFPTDRLSAAQQYADALRRWFEPYLRRRPAVESLGAVFNFPGTVAPEVPGLSSLLARIESHLQDHYGLLDRNTAAANRETCHRPSRLDKLSADVQQITASVQQLLTREEQLSAIVQQIAADVREIQLSQLRPPQPQPLPARD